MQKKKVRIYGFCKDPWLLHSDLKVKETVFRMERNISLKILKEKNILEKVHCLLKLISLTRYYAIRAVGCLVWMRKFCHYQGK